VLRTLPTGAIDGGVTTGTGSTVVLDTSPTIATPSMSGVVLSDKISAPVLATDSSGTIQFASTTGAGNVVLNTSPTLVTPTLGTATGTALTLSGPSPLQITSTTGSPAVQSTVAAGQIYNQFITQSDVTNSTANYKIYQNFNGTRTAIVGQDASQNFVITNNYTAGNMALTANGQTVTLKPTGVVSLPTSQYTSSNYLSTDASGNLVASTARSSLPLRLFIEEGTTVGTAVTWVSLTSQWCAGYSFMNNTTAGGTTWTSPNFFLPNGTYTIRVRYTQLTTGGQIVFTPFTGGVAGTAVSFGGPGFLECWNTATTAGNVSSTITFTGAGVNQIVLTVPTKNATSTSFTIPIMKIFINQ
jgi:hypothetical protein